MHIHASLMSVQAASLAGAGNARAENAEKAAQTRRQLRKAAQHVDTTSFAADAAAPDASFLVGEWLNVRHNHSLADDKYTPGS
ncbi:MAG: hypothetical protein ABR928_00445 [Terracidiphilus sp.]|jgi:hypothetical protein